MECSLIDIAVLALCTGNGNISVDKESARQIVMKSLFYNACKPSIYLDDGNHVTTIAIGSTRLLMKNSVVYYERVVGNRLVSVPADVFGRELIRTYRLHHHSFLCSMMSVVGHRDVAIEGCFVKLLDDLIQHYVQQCGN